MEGVLPLHPPLPSLPKSKWPCPMRGVNGRLGEGEGEGGAQGWSLYPSRCGPLMGSDLHPTGQRSSSSQPGGQVEESKYPSLPFRKGGEGSAFGEDRRTDRRALASAGLLSEECASRRACQVVIRCGYPKMPTPDKREKAAHTKRRTLYLYVGNELQESRGTGLLPLQEKRRSAQQRQDLLVPHHRTHLLAEFDTPPLDPTCCL